MGWVVAATGIVYLLAQGTLLYGLFAVHGRDGIAALWGFTPNQFWFLVFIFPLATICTFTSLRFLVHHVEPALPRESALRWILSHWVVALLWCLMLACVVVWIDYFQSPKSFDKLRPEYARRAVEAFRAVERQKIPMEDSGDSSALASVAETAVAAHRLTALPPLQYLRIVQDRDLQLRLGLLDPRLIALYTLQVLLAFFVAFVSLFVVIATAGTLISLGPNSPPMLWRAYTTVLLAICFLAFFVLAFRQYRLELDRLVGDESTFLPHVFAGGVIVVVLTVLAAIGPTGKLDAAQFLTARLLPRLFPIGVFVAGLIAERKVPDIFRRLIGVETNVGIQLMWMLVTIIAAAILLVVFWSQDLHPPPSRGLEL